MRCNATTSLNIIHRFLAVAIFAIFLSAVGCKQAPVLPKPKAELRLEYTRPTTNTYQADNFSFQYNQAAKVKSKNAQSLGLFYPEMKGQVFVTYREVKGDVAQLIADAKKLSYEHSAKADGITEQPFMNAEHKVYGTFFQITGDAASQAQFYATDSTKHFLTGSLYFMIKPNYDSIYPAAAYLQNDIRGMMETLRWKN